MTLQIIVCAAIVVLFPTIAEGIQCDQNNQTNCTKTPHAEIEYSWFRVNYNWPNPTFENISTTRGEYIPSHNMISGIKVYRGEVFVTVPRLVYMNGVPSTLNRIVTKNGAPVLQPFPNWQYQKQDNCLALQCAMSMEIDPLTGYMYVIDVGRVGVFGKEDSKGINPKYCGAKLVVFDIKKNSLVRIHFLPQEVVPKETNFLNDVVLDRGGPTSKNVRWVYITDAKNGVLYSFDLLTNKTRSFHHVSMAAEKEDSDIVVNGVSYHLPVPIDGLAISRTNEFVYYCALGSKKLFQVRTAALRQPDLYNFGDNVRYVGDKVSQTGGMVYGTDNLYYGALTEDAVYRWSITKDESLQVKDEGAVRIQTQEAVVKDSRNLIWPDSFTIDEQGNLWFTACKAQLFLKEKMDWSGKSGDNFRIWKVKINESSYLEPYSL